MDKDFDLFDAKSKSQQFGHQIETGAVNMFDYGFEKVKAYAEANELKATKGAFLTYIIKKGLAVGSIDEFFNQQF